MADELEQYGRPEGAIAVPIVYANWVVASPGPFDLALDFGYSMPGEGAQMGVRVAMTWEHAKILQDVMNKMIAQREGNAGEIKAPPGITLAERDSITGERKED